MAKEAPPASSSRRRNLKLDLEMKTSWYTEEDLAGVEAKTWCDHLGSLSPDLAHIPTPNSHCFSRFVNKHMVEHNQETSHCLALSFSDLSVWCYSCEAYLDAQVIAQLRPVYETTYLLKFGEDPPFRAVQNPGAIGSSSSS
ncbi:unnamed protein product [Rhodiola kirilowii]